MQGVINFNNLKEYDGKLKEVVNIWQKQKAYSIDYIVQYKGRYLKCTTAGTSGTTTLDFTDVEIGDTITDGTVTWEVIGLFGVSGTSITDWESETTYSVGDLVIYDNNIYKCNTNHTSTTFSADKTKWTSIGGVDLPEWQANTSYTAGKYLVHEGTVYKVTTNFTSSTEFDDTNLEVYIAPNYNIYSTTEQEIGTWIDGKKLYRRTFNNPTDGLSTGLTSSLVSIKRIYGHCIQENEWQFDIPFYEPNGGIALYIDVLTGILSIDCYGNYMSGCVFPYVTVEYTKN